MDGNTKDLMDEDSFTVEIANIMQAQMGLPLTREEIVKLMGIKRTNASTLLTVGRPGTAWNRGPDRRAKGPTFLKVTWIFVVIL